MNKTFNFGKIGYCNSRKINSVSVNISLRDLDGNGHYEFSAIGMIWNARNTKCVVTGQCLDTIKKYRVGELNNEVFNEIYDLWKKHHLNGMHSGTMRQESAIREKFGNIDENDYQEKCDYLRSIGLYEADLEDGELNLHGSSKGYLYGTGWIYRIIPEKDLTRIKELLAI